MNRVIKFRLRVDNAIVGYEKWFAGARNDMGEVAKPQWLYSKDGEYWNPEPIHNRQKDEYTNLLDKDGKEIYEGDVVRILYTDWPSQIGYELSLEEYKKSISRIGRVVYAGGSFSIEFDKNHATGSLFEGTHGEKEVIGNIYENPELIEHD